RPGLYEVQVWIPSRNGTTWAARYWLVSSYFYMPIKDTIVDQRGISDRWISLGVYQFGRWPAAPWLGVWVSDSTGESPSSLRHLAVDAIRFRTPWPVYIPVVLKNY
ncbi:MAG: hypothetical protein N0A15_16640, partial [Anaerolineae bacterium]|nr:hypothetical protein [Anaerolineae bacterium]